MMRNKFKKKILPETKYKIESSVFSAALKCFTIEPTKKKNKNHKTEKKSRLNTKAKKKKTNKRGTGIAHVEQKNDNK